MADDDEEESSEDENIKTNFKRELSDLRQFGRSHGLNDNEINNCIKDLLPNECVKTMKNGSKLLKIVRLAFLTIALVLFLALLLVSFHKPSQKRISRQIQVYIYPFMRYFRLLTLPINRRFPEITGWHEQQCIIHNPFYRNPDLMCWPCEKVRSVVDLSDFENFTTSYYQNGTPFVVKNFSKKSFTMSSLEELYSKNSYALNGGTASFYSSSKDVQKPKDVTKLLDNDYDDLHIEWQFRRVCSARVLRSVFVRPSFVPLSTEVSLERFLFIDGLSASRYTLPLSEFANVLIVQGSGTRSLVLMPSPHCSNSCQPVFTSLTTDDLLYYNWQFWRVSFLPSASPSSLIEHEYSITYMSSFY